MAEYTDSVPQAAGSLVNELIGTGVNLFEEQIDNTIFNTNAFLTNSDFIGPNGPFFWILEICMILASMFCLILAAQMAFKMIVKHEPIDVLKLFKPLAISFVLTWWYPPQDTGTDMVANRNSTDCILDVLAVLPNAIGSYTHDLYQVEALNVQYTYQQVEVLMQVRDDRYKEDLAKKKRADDELNSKGQSQDNASVVGLDKMDELATMSIEEFIKSGWAGIMIFIDKLIMFIALVTYRIGWWGIIYSQQIILAVLTIFGPIHWAMSLLPKWEGAWAKWITRYLSVHFYGAMLYFVGFYVLLLFDIVLSMQFEDLMMVTTAAAEDTGAFQQYIKDTFFTTGYLMAASVVSLKCLSMVPDLASWLIPEGEISFSARGFGDGVGGEMKSKIGSVLSGRPGGIF